MLQASVVGTPTSAEVEKGCEQRHRRLEQTQEVTVSNVLCICVYNGIDDGERRADRLSWRAPTRVRKVECQGYSWVVREEDAVGAV